MLVCYVLSISLQISGALMLIVFGLSCKRESIIRSFAKSHIVERNGITKELSYDHKVFIEEYRKVYYCRISVACILTGYLISVFAELGRTNRFLVAGIIVLVSVIIILVSKRVVDSLMETDKVKKLITSEELESAGCTPDIESLTKDQLENLEKLV